MSLLRECTFIAIKIKFEYIFSDSTTKRKIEESPNAIKEPESKMTKISSPEDKLGDLIVLGLPWKTTSEDMREYFQKFGEVSMAEVNTCLLIV